MHPFRCASRLHVQFFFDKNQGSYFIVWTCHVESFAVTAWIFSHLTFNVSLFMFCWNFSNDRCSLLYICPTSIWTLEESNSSSMWRIVLCRASKPLRSIALSDSTNVSIGWISSLIGGSSIHIVSITSSTSSSITTQYSSSFASSNATHLLGMFGLSQVGCLMSHLLPVTTHRIRGPRKLYE